MPPSPVGPLRALLALSTWALLVGAQGSPAPAVERVVDPRVTAAELEADVTWLAADERRGRETGSPEAVEAGRWLAASLEAAGVEPAGDEGFLQRVPLGARIVYDAVPTLGVAPAGGAERVAVWGVDFDRVWGAVPAADLELVVLRSADDLPVEASAARAVYVAARGREARELEGQLGDTWGLVVTRGSTRPGRGPSSAPPRPGRVPEGPPRVRVRGPWAYELATAEGARLRVAAPGDRIEQQAYN